MTNRVVLLDSGPLGEIISPKPKGYIKDWLSFIKQNKISLRVPEIIDYEIRRNLILSNLGKSERRLNQYRNRKEFIHLNSEILICACEIWAELRRIGQPTASKERLDIDVLLIAQAISQTDSFEEVIIVTTNVKHLIRCIEYGIQVWDWQQALQDAESGEINLVST